MKMSCVGKSHFKNMTYVHFVYEDVNVNGLGVQQFGIWDENKYIHANDIQVGKKYDVTYRRNGAFLNITRIKPIEDNIS